MKRIIGLALLIGCSKGNPGSDGPDASTSAVDFAHAQLAVADSFIQPSTSMVPEPTVTLAVLMPDRPQCPTVEAGESFAATYGGVPMAPGLDIASESSPLPPTRSDADGCHLLFSLSLDGAQITTGDVEVAAFGAAIHATFPAQLLEPRTPTPLDDPPYVFTAGTTYRFRWSHPADLVFTVPAPVVAWNGGTFPGSEIPPPTWHASGTITVDQLAFVADASSYPGTHYGVVMFSLGQDTGSAAACDAAQCMFALTHVAAHAAQSN